MTDKKKIFSVFLIVLAVCLFNVHCFNLFESYEKKRGKEKEKAKKPKPKDSDPLRNQPEPVTVAPVNETNASDIMAELNEFKKFPPMHFITYGPYTFEGVDYQLLPENILNVYNDCYGHHARCVRNLVYATDLCAHSLVHGTVRFVNMCQLELENCNYRVWHNKGLYGQGMQDDDIYFQGEGWTCGHDMRRANSRNDTEIEGLQNSTEGNEESSTVYEYGSNKIPEENH